MEQGSPPRTSDPLAIGSLDWAIALIAGLGCLAIGSTLASPFVQFPDFVHIYAPWADELARAPWEPSALARYAAYPPGYPLLVAALGSLLGGYAAAGKAIALASTALLCVTSVLMGSLIRGPLLGAAVGVFFLLNPVFLWHAGKEGADAPAAALSMAALVLHLSAGRRGFRRGMTVGLLLAAGYWFRLQVVLAVAVVVADLAFRLWKGDRHGRAELLALCAGGLLLAGPLVVLRAAMGRPAPGIGTVLLNAGRAPLGSVEQISSAQIVGPQRSLFDAASELGWGGVAHHWVQHGILQTGQLQMTGLPLQWLVWGGVGLLAATGGCAGRLLVGLLAFKVALFGFYHVETRLFLDLLPLFQIAPLYLTIECYRLSGRTRLSGAVVSMFIVFAALAGVKWYLTPALASPPGDEFVALARRLDACRAATQDGADLSIRVYDPRSPNVDRFRPLLVEAYRAGADTWPEIEALMQEHGKRFLIIDEQATPHLEHLRVFQGENGSQGLRLDLIAGREGARLALLVHRSMICD